MVLGSQTTYFLQAAALWQCHVISIAGVCVCVWCRQCAAALRQSASTVVTTNDCCVAVASLPAAAIVADLVRRRHRKWPVFGRR